MRRRTRKKWNSAVNQSNSRLEGTLAKLIRTRCSIAACPQPSRKEVLRDFLRWSRDTSSLFPTQVFYVEIPEEGQRNTNLVLTTNTTSAPQVQTTPDTMEPPLPVPPQNPPTDEQEEVEEVWERQEESTPVSDEAQDGDSNQEGTEDASNMSLLVNVPSTISTAEDESRQLDDSESVDSSGPTPQPAPILNIEEERRWLRYRVEQLSRDECVVICVLGHMILNEEEIYGRRDCLPTDEEARQSLLCLAMGSHWDLVNLGIVMDWADKLSPAFRNLETLGVRDRSSAGRRLLELRLDAFLGIQLNRANRPAH